MGIEQLIAGGIQPVQIASPMNTLAQAMQLRGMQQDYALNRMKMQGMQTAMDEQNALRRSIQGYDPSTPEGQQGIAQAHLRYGDVKGYQEAASGFAKLSKDQREAEKARLEQEAAKASSVAQDAGALVLDPALTLDKADAMLRSHVGNGTLDPGVYAAFKQQPPQSLDELRHGLQVLQRKGLSTKDQIEAQKLHFQDLGNKVAALNQYTGAPVADYAKGADPSIVAGAPTLTTIRDPKNPSRLITVNARQYSPGASDIGAPGVIGQAKDDTLDVQLNTREKARREAAYPKVTAALKESDADFDKVLSTATELLNHPGLSHVTGTIAGRTPNLSTSATNAQALINTIMAKGQFGALQQMRAASSTGGALGNVSDTEGKTLRDSFAVLQQSQGTPEYKRHLQDFIDQVKAAKERLHQAYEMEYEYKGSAGGGAPAPATAPSSGWGTAKKVTG